MELIVCDHTCTESSMRAMLRYVDVNMRAVAPLRSIDGLPVSELFEGDTPLIWAIR